MSNTSKLWSELVDAYSEMSKNMNRETVTRYLNAENALIDELGEDGYKRFVEMGKQMFGVK